jgi:hypothetical protein
MFTDGEFLNLMVLTLYWWRPGASPVLLPQRDPKQRVKSDDNVFRISGMECNDSLVNDN